MPQLHIDNPPKEDFTSLPEAGFTSENWSLRDYSKDSKTIFKYDIFTYSKLGYWEKVPK